MVKSEWLEKGYVDEPVDKALDLKAEIDRLRKEKNAVILGHYYQSGEIQDIADFVGDSLALAQWAAKTDADIIVMCGVHFMGESPLSRKESAGTRLQCRLFIGRQLSGRQVCTVCQGTPRPYGHLLCQHYRSCQGGDRCSRYFHQCQADSGKFPKGRKNNLWSGQEFGQLY